MAPGTAADLSKIDRTIKKEPNYKTKPRYCWLVFGPEARKRLWLVLDLIADPVKSPGSQSVLYVDRNGEGDLTQKGKRVTDKETVVQLQDEQRTEFDIELIDDGACGNKYTVTLRHVARFNNRWETVSGRIFTQGPMKLTQFAPVDFASQAKDAAVIHHGPVQIPDEAGAGKAKSTLSFADWKEGPVAPATFEMPIVEPDAGGARE